MDLRERERPLALTSNDLGATWRAYEVEAQVQDNLAEINRRYRRLQIVAGCKHGLVVGVIIFLNLKIWGII